MKRIAPTCPLLVLLFAGFLNLSHAEVVTKPCNMSAKNVMYQRDTYFIITNIDGRTLAVPDSYRYRVYDTNGFVIKSENTSVKNGVTNSRIEDNIKLKFLSGKTIVWDETNGLKDDITEYDPLGQPLAKELISNDAYVVPQVQFATRQENGMRYQIETDCCSGKKSMVIYRNNLPVLEVVDNFRYGQPLYRYYYYYRKKLTSQRAVMKFGPHEETMFHVVYYYDGRDLLIKEERQNYHDPVNHVMNYYSYDDFGNLTRCEEYGDDQLTFLHVAQYVYWK